MGRIIDLSSVSDEQLQAELAKREEAKREAKKPRMVDNPDWSKVRDICQGVIDYTYEHGYYSGVSHHHIVVEVMKALFGDDIIEWINEQ